MSTEVKQFTNRITLLRHKIYQCRLLRIEISELKFKWPPKPNRKSWNVNL